MVETIRTTCPYCGVGCGILASARDEGCVDIKGDPEHPANFGRLCSKGSALGETVSLDGRLLYPQVTNKRSDWEDALDQVAGEFQSAIRSHGPDAVAFYVSGQILTEDYYVANKLMKGFIGSANIDTNSRLCMASSVAGHKRAFGSDTVPGIYEDLENADLVVLVGSNLAWCHPVLHQRLLAAKKERPDLRVVVIDPRRTMTAEMADLHFPIAADGDVALFNGLLSHLAQDGHTDSDYIARHTNGFDTALAEAQKKVGSIEADTGLDTDEIDRFFALFSATRKVVTVYSQGVNQSRCGTDKVNAIINCHLATGRIGTPGAGPFSVTGQPNAMGGREVGGLANMLAAHMDLDNPEHRQHVQTFWQSPVIADKQGLKAVDLFQAVSDGRIKALWIMGTNPVDSLPDASRVEQAIKECPFVVVSDVINETDTIRHADVRLPSLAWGEKDGTVTNSERRISRQRAFLPPPGDARADWWQVCEVAKRMGFGEAFSYTKPAEIFREHAALSAFRNSGTRDFDIGAFSELTDGAYDALAPIHWPQPKTGTAKKRFFSDGDFYTSDRNAIFVAVSSPKSRQMGRDQLILNTGRIRDQWHTMTRTGRSPTNSAHLAEPYCEIHPEDALRLGLSGASLCEVQSEYGGVVLRVLITPRQQQGSLFVPLHWTDQFASNARVDKLVEPVVDPVSGQPALKSTCVEIRPYRVAQYGFLISRFRPQIAQYAQYWAVARTNAGWRTEFASTQPLDRDELYRLATNQNSPSHVSEVKIHDGHSALAVFEETRLQAAVFVSTTPVSASRQWLCEQLAVSDEAGAGRLAILAGRPPASVQNKGPLVCACNAVGANQINELIGEGMSDVDAIGKACLAGTTCGSCRSEIEGMINAAHLVAAE